MLEAMAAGQALIATNVGGLGEVLEHQKTAILVAPGNGPEMAQALQTLFSSPALQMVYSTAALEVLQKDFHPARVAQQTIDFIMDISDH
jgi:glycosyltransferase involved in cell wall biosynthesis